MRRSLPLLVLVSFLLLPTAAEAAWGSSKPSVGERFWFGGGIGLGFGDVNWVSISPILGYRLSPKASIGIGLIYRRREDGRYEPTFSTSDYGGSFFGRYRIGKGFFVHGEYEYLSYEYPMPSGGTERDDFPSLFGGAGFSRPIGEKSSWFVLGLYNFLYDSTEVPRPYNSAFVLRAGVGFRF